jgi:hypothetical protein
LAAEVREIRHGVRQAPRGLARRWLHGPQFIDIIVDYEGDEIICLEITYLGNWLIFEDQRLATGQTDELDADQGHPQSRLIDPHERTHDPILAGARVLLNNLKDQSLGQQLLALLPPD